MRLIYVDESGISSGERIAVVAGVIIDADRQYVSVSEYIQRLIREYVPPEHQNGFTFHAKELFHGGKSGSAFDRRTFPAERAHEALRKLVGIPSFFDLPIAYGYVVKGTDPIRPTLPPRKNIALDTALAFSGCAAAAEAFMKDRTPANEVATIHAENNTDTQKMVRIARRLLSGRTEFNIAKAMGGVQAYLPITRIVDEISFHEKDDAFLLQIADACALALRYILERRQKCDALIDAFTSDQYAVRDYIANQPNAGACGYNLLLFADHPFVA